MIKHAFSNGKTSKQFVIYYQTFDNITKDHGCSGGLRNIILEE